jgi:hypothetical protein
MDGHHRGTPARVWGNARCRMKEYASIKYAFHPASYWEDDPLQ